MRFLRYGITLQRLDRQDLEMVRQWRNQERIRSRMQFSEEVSFIAQAAWFSALDLRRDWYFVASVENLPFGLFHIKQIGWDTRTGEAGGFVGVPRLIGGVEAGTAILALMDFAFFQLGLHFLEITYRPDGSHLEVLNGQLGYKTVRLQSNGFVRARVSTGDFLSATKAVRRAAEHLQEKQERAIEMNGLKNSVETWAEPQIPRLRSG